MHFGNDPRPGDDKVIKVEKDEYVVNRNASRKHKQLLDYLNFIDEPRFENKEMAHSAIDEAITLNTLSQVGMQNGGEVKEPELDFYLAGHKSGHRGDMLAYANPQDSTVFYQDQYQPFIYDRMGRLSGFVDDKGGRHFHTNDELFEQADELSEGSGMNYRSIGQLGNEYLDEIGEGQKYSDFTFPGRQPRRGQSNKQAMENLLPAHPLNFRSYQQGGLAGYQNGGEVKDRRNRKGGYSLGVKDELTSTLDYFKDIESMLPTGNPESEYTFPKLQRESLDWLKESDAINLEEALRNLDAIQKSYHQGQIGFSTPRYQTGGNVSYGGESTERATIEDIYKAASVMPNAEQLPSFESSFGELGEGRFVGAMGDYQSALDTMKTSGTGQIGKATSDTTGYTFGEIGIKKAIEKEVRNQAERGVMIGRDDAKRNLFEKTRSINENYKTSGVNELRRLEGIGGTVPYPPPSGGGDIFFGEEGTGYMGTGFGGGAFGGGEGDTTVGAQTSPLVNPGSYDGETIDYNGDTYIWDGSSWQIQTTGVTGGTGLSDKRLKKDINHLFTMNNGVPIYTFKYNWSDDVEIGTMAQDIENFMPEAVSESNGYKLVDYKQVFK